MSWKVILMLVCSAFLCACIGSPPQQFIGIAPNGEVEVLAMDPGSGKLIPPMAEPIPFCYFINDPVCYFNMQRHLKYTPKG